MTGDERRDEGAGRAAGAAPEWMELARLAIEVLVKTRPHGFTSDDVRMLAGDPPKEHCTVVGSAILAASKAGLIVKTGERIKSKRPEANSRELAVWRAA